MRAGKLARMNTVRLAQTIQQGATFKARVQRLCCPYPFRVENERLVHATTGKLIPMADLVPVDYTGARARMQLRRSITSPEVLFEFSTEPTASQGRMVLMADGWIELTISAELTAAMPYGKRAGQWSTAIGHLEVIYAEGTVERAFEIDFYLDPEVTRDDSSSS